MSTTCLSSSSYHEQLINVTHSWNTVCSVYLAVLSHRVWGNFLCLPSQISILHVHVNIVHPSSGVNVHEAKHEPEQADNKCAGDVFQQLR